jgi:hypothetical protein
MKVIFLFIVLIAALSLEFVQRVQLNRRFFFIMRQLEEWGSLDFYQNGQIPHGLEDKTEQSRSIKAIVNFWEPAEVGKNLVF